LVKELKQKSTTAKILSDRFQETQRAIRDLQVQIEQATRDAATFREDAAFHRAKGDEAARKTAEETRIILRDSNIKIEALEKQLHDKTRESDQFQRLLADVRKHLGLLTETTVPELREQITQMNEEQDELLVQVRKLVETSQQIEAAIATQPESSEGTAFATAMRQLQEELQHYPG
jgi:methyl-accepting chemotaxis protein